MSGLDVFPANLELRESTDEGEVTSGLSHSSGGMFLLFVQEVASEGEPRGAITFVHDAGDHGGRYLDLGRELAERAWAVSLPDMRGHGRSEGERGHSGGIGEAIRDLGDIQDHLSYMAPTAPRILIGQGLGALQALAFACERPQSLVGLVLSSPLLEPRFQLPERKTGLKKLFSKVGPRTPGSTGYAPDQLTGDEAQARAWSADELTHDRISLHAGTQALEAARQYAGRLGALGVPTLVLQGDADPIGSPARVGSLSGEGVEVCSFEGLRHDLFHEARRDEVVSALCDWLDRLPLGP